MIFCCFFSVRGVLKIVMEKNPIAGGLFKAVWNQNVEKYQLSSFREDPPLVQFKKPFKVQIVCHFILFNYMATTFHSFLGKNSLGGI